MPGMRNQPSRHEELGTLVSTLATALQLPGVDLVDEWCRPDMHPALVLARIQAFRDRVIDLYNDPCYESNPTREVWDFLLMLHQDLCEDSRTSLDCCRRLVRSFLLHCLGSWEAKDSWEIDVEHILREKQAEEAVLTA